MPQGNNLPPIGYCDVEPIAGYGHIPPGLYLKLIWTRANLNTGTIRASIWWGKKG
jgi:hypothetical protein